jgi:hypothetical protein
MKRKGPKLLISAICVIVAIAAAVAAIIIFRNEIAFFFKELKEKVEEKKWFTPKGEFSDYADV